MEARFADRIRTQSVRELAWAIEGPTLVDPSVHPRFRPFVDDSRFGALLARARDRILELDADPAPLERDLGSRLRNGRLGERFEVLIAYWLEKIIGVSDFNYRLAVRDERRTIGEMDFVFRDPDRGIAVHWEVTTKFYMQTGETLSSCVGTDTMDRLDEKIDYTLDSQLKLPLKEPARIRLLELGYGDVLSEAVMKGYLFQPKDRYPGVVPPSPVSARRSIGWWSHLSKMSLSACELESRWMLLPRLIRIAPGRTEDESQLLFGHELPGIFRERLEAQPESSVMFARMERRGDAWVETERGWVVSDGFVP